MSVRNFAQAVTRLHFQSVRFGEDARCFHRAAEGRSINGRDFFGAQPLREVACLFAAFIRKWNIGRAGKAILRAQDCGAVANEKNPRSRRRHNARLLRPVRRTFFQKRRDAFFRFGRFARLHVVLEGTLDIVFHRGRPEFFNQTFRVAERVRRVL